jgi:hypothetical protein
LSSRPTSLEVVAAIEKYPACSSDIRRYHGNLEQPG